MPAVEPAFHGLYAGSSLEISAATAAQLNAVAARAGDTVPGDFVEFQAGEVVSISCAARPLPRAVFIDAYRRLRAVIDGAIEIRLADHPHVFSADPDDADRLRGVPTYIPKSLFGPDFFGRAHQVELVLDDGGPVFGPVERFFHHARSGVLYDHIEDAPGGLVLEVRGDLEGLTGREVVFLTDPVFGEPVAVTELGDDGSSRPLAWRMLGRARVGEVSLFNEWEAVGVQPRGGRLVIDVRLPHQGIGLAGALFAGHTRDTALRADATVL